MFSAFRTDAILTKPFFKFFQIESGTASFFRLQKKRLSIFSLQLLWKTELTVIKHKDDDRFGPRCRTAKQSSHLLHKNGKLNGQPHENISHSVPKKTARFFLASWKEFLYSDVVAHTNIKKEKERPTTVRSFSCARTSRARDLCPTNMAFVQHRLL